MFVFACHVPKYDRTNVVGAGINVFATLEHGAKFRRHQT